jgi:hypothetical protein
MNELSAEPIQTVPEPLPGPSPSPLSEPPRDPPLAGEATRRPLPVGGILGLVVILLLLGAVAGYYAWHGQAVQQNRQIETLDAKIGALQTNMTALAARRQMASPPAVVKIPASLTGQINSVRQNVNALTASIATDHATIASLRSSEQSGLDAADASLKNLQSSLASMQAKFAALQSSIGAMPALAARARRLDRIAAASLALQNGQPLGTIQDAPPALARYATTAPPTEAGLRRAFPIAARQAIAAGGSVQGTGGYWQRLKMRVAGLVTVQRHGKVLIGSQVSGMLAAAQNDLDLGDLQNAVTTLQALPPQAKVAMQSWLDQANGLLAARHALADPALTNGALTSPPSSIPAGSK